MKHSVQVTGQLNPSLGRTALEPQGSNSNTGSLIHAAGERPYIMFILGTAGSWLASCAAVCACQACQCVTKEMLRKSARLAYCALFTLAMVLAWILRDFAKPLIEKIPCEALLLQSC